MRKYYLLSIIFLGFLQSYAQENDFYIKERFFEGEKVKMFSESRGGAVVVLDDHSIHLMDKDFQFTDVSHLFQSEILEDLSSIESVNERVFLIGTKENSLYMYDEGEIISIKDLNPDLPDQINSIDFYASSFNQQVLLATNDNVWASNNFKTYVKDEVPYTDSTRFFSGRSAMLLTDYTPNCPYNSGEYGVRYKRSHFTFFYKMPEIEGFDVNGLNDISYVNHGSVSSNYYTYAYYGTENGIYAQRIYFCDSAYTVSHFTDMAVNDLEVVNSGLTESAIFAASDSGLLFKESSSYLDPEYYNVEGIDSAYTVNYSIYHNIIWVGTENGLVQIFDDQLTQEPLLPEMNEPVTIDFCKSQGVSVEAEVNKELDFQWYRDGEEIDSVLSRGFVTYEEGLYSIKFTFEGQLYEHDVALVQLDSVFDERIVEQDYLICYEGDMAYVEIENFTYSNHLYEWYSVERGLEFETSGSQNYFYAEEAGNYFFVATNCNQFTYQSDTVEVVKSQLTEPFFTIDLNDQNLCEGDTLFLDGIDYATNFSWKINYDIIEDYNEAYLVVDKEYAYEDVSVVVSDQYGCEYSVWGDIGYVEEEPYLSEAYNEIYICEQEDYVYFELDDGLSAEWAGYTDGIDQKVAPGIYPVTISNGVCPDYNVEVEIKYFDPFPILNFEDTVIQVGDTFKIPTNGKVGINWEGEIQVSSDQSYLYLTSDVADTLQSELWFSSADCEQLYSFTIFFEGPPILNNDSHETDFRIYPNPTKEGVNIAQSKSTIDCIQLLNLDGRIVDTKYFQNASSLYFEFPSHLEAGTYFIRITDINNQVVTRKVVLE